jgi:hypothetical protein
MIRYKVLNPDMCSPFQNFKYEIGNLYSCDNFDTDTNECCSNGFYATGIEGILYSNLSNSKIVMECEVSGDSVEIDQFKMRYEKIKIIREVRRRELRNLIKDESDKLSYNLYQAIFPINPLNININKINIELVKELKMWDSVRDSVWDSVWDSVRDSVWASVWASVRASVRASVWASVWDSVRASVWDSVRGSVWGSVWASVRGSVRDSVWASVWASVRDSVWAYISSLFTEINKWKYLDHPIGENPFQPAINMWKSGIITSFDGEVYRAHSGKNANVIYEISKNDLEKVKL